MNPNIILAGNQLDVMGAISGANDAAQNQLGYQRGREIEQLYKTQGAGMLAGDPGAMNALAGYSPEAAQGLQQNQLGMDQTRQNMAFSVEEMQMKRDEGKRMAAEHIAAQGAALTAQQAAQEAAETERGIAAISTAKTPEQFDQIARQFGQENLVGQFENKDALIASYMGIADALKEFGSINPNDRFKVAGQTLFDLGAEGGPKAVGEGSTPEETIYDPATGNPIVTRGGKRESKATEGNLSAEGYLQRMRGAEGIFDSLQAAGTTAINLSDTFAVGTRAEPYKLSVPEQKLMQAQRDWVRAKLRKESGAVIGDEEMAEEIRTYFPQPGQGPEIVAQKKEARRRAEEQMQIGAGFGATPAEKPTASAQPAKPDFTQMQVADVLKQDVTRMTSEELQAFAARMEELGL